MRKHCAQLAQLVEQRTENPCVSGSIPELGILIYYGILAQVVEHLTFNQVVRGSSPRWLTKLEDCITMQSFFILLCSKFLMQKSKISTQIGEIRRKG